MQQLFINDQTHIMMIGRIFLKVTRHMWVMLWFQTQLWNGVTHSSFTLSHFHSTGMNSYAYPYRPEKKIFSFTCLHLSILGSRLPGKLTILPRYSSHSVTNRDIYVEITSMRPCLARHPEHNFDISCTWIELKEQGTGDSSFRGRTKKFKTLGQSRPTTGQA